MEIVCVQLKRNIQSVRKYLENQPSRIEKIMLPPSWRDASTTYKSTRKSPSSVGPKRRSHHRDFPTPLAERITHCADTDARCKTQNVCFINIIDEDKTNFIIDKLSTVLNSFSGVWEGFPAHIISYGRGGIQVLPLPYPSPPLPQKFSFLFPPLPHNIWHPLPFRLYPFQQAVREKYIL